MGTQMIFAKFGWGGDNQSLHLVDGLGAGLDGRVLGALEHADHFDFALTRLGRGICYSGQDRPGCHLRIGGIALPFPVAGGPIGSVDLNDGVSATG